MRCILVGNYGVGNLGDELLKEYFLNCFSEKSPLCRSGACPERCRRNRAQDDTMACRHVMVSPDEPSCRHFSEVTDIQWTVVSANPGMQEVPRLPLGFRSFFRPWWRTIRAYRECDAVVFGGGSLFTDTESPFACVLWWWHAFSAWVLRKPFFLAFQGIGPFGTRMGKICTRWVVRRATFCSVRDEASAKRVEEWGGTVVRSIDPVVGMIQLGVGDRGLGIGDRFVIIPRQNSGEDFLDRVREIVRNDVWDEIVILSLQPDHRGEQKVCEQLREELKRATIVPVYSLETLVREIQGAELVCSQRYHGALSALLLKKKIEIIHQAEGDKLSVMRESLSDGISALRRGEETLRSALMRAVSSL